QDELLDMLRTDDLDCVFTAVDPDRIGNEFAATLLWEDEYVVAMPPGHPLAERDHVTLEELAGEDLIAYRENSALRLRLEAKMGERGRAGRAADRLAAARPRGAHLAGRSDLARRPASAPGGQGVPIPRPHASR